MAHLQPELCSAASHDAHWQTGRESAGLMAQVTRAGDSGGASDQAGKRPQYDPSVYVGQQFDLDLDALRSIFQFPSTPTYDARSAKHALYEEFKKPCYRIDYGWDKYESRKAAYKQFREFLKGDFTNVYDLRDNPARFMTAIAVAQLHDFALAGRIAIHFELFGMTILELGSQKHMDKYLPLLNTGEITGCFSMTEIGHGSNVKEVGTTATYDIKRQEFVLNTPDEMSTKIWIGCSAMGARNTTIVFARLIIKGVDYGVHAFVCPLKQENNQFTKGVWIQDVGDKAGWHGIDNSVIQFHNVRVPLDNMLDRFSQVAPDGTYSSKIKNETLRFAETLSALVFGRLLYCMGPVGALVVGTTITGRYAIKRRQFGPPNMKEVNLLTYTSHKLKLMPMIASTYAYYYMTQSLLEGFGQMAGGTMDKGEFHALVSGSKALVCEYTTDSLSKMRVMCGGHGYAAANKLGLLRDDFDNFQTAEGDTTVLRQQTARYVMKKFQDKYSGGKLERIMKYYVDEAVTTFTKRNIIMQNRADRDHLLSDEFLDDCFQVRIERLVINAGMKMAESMKQYDGDRNNKGAMFFLAWNHALPDLLQLSDAYTVSEVVKQFRQRLQAVQDDKTRETLLMMCQLYALDHIRNNLAFYLGEKFFAGRKSAAIESLYLDLCERLSVHTLDLIDGYDIPDHLVRAPIGVRDGDYARRMLDNSAPHEEINCHLELQ
eukprot:GFYU01008693.1.p1 GENE.GFYU01008693.1~~GFYU01008693.1.p1  ORF type:complete len:752 (+),score=231.65 GFYU01008693.1:117-2258(+)